MRAMLVCLVTSAAMLASGYVGPTEATKNENPYYKRLRDATQSEMNQLMRSVTSAQLAKCRQLLEQPDGWGDTHKVVGTFRPSVKHSCVTQLRESNFAQVIRQSTSNSAKAISFAVQLTKVGEKPSGQATRVGGCHFRFAQTGGLVSMIPFNNLQFSSDSQCKHL